MFEDCERASVIVSCAYSQYLPVHDLPYGDVDTNAQCRARMMAIQRGHNSTSNHIKMREFSFSPIQQSQNHKKEEPHNH